MKTKPNEIYTFIRIYKVVGINIQYSQPKSLVL